MVKGELFTLPAAGLPVAPVETGQGNEFDEASAFTLAWETGGDLQGGGLNDTPGDPGGLTKFGISSTYNPDVDVQALTLADAAKVLKSRYWDKQSVGQIKDPMVRAVVFDMNMNATRGAAEAAQRIAGDVEPQLKFDGVMGSGTVAAINKYVEERGAWDFVIRFNEARRDRVQRRTAPYLRRGLLRRIDELEAWIVSNPFPSRGKKGASQIGPGEVYLTPGPQSSIGGSPMSAAMPPMPTGGAMPPSQAGAAPVPAAATPDPQGARQMQFQAILTALSQDGELLQMVLGAIQEAAANTQMNQAQAGGPAAVERALYG